MRRLITPLVGLMLAAAGPHMARQTVSVDPFRPVNEAIHSKVLGEDRPLEIYLPSGYDPKAASTYDVIYVLDAEMLVRFFPPVRAFEEENDLMPPAIIVGVKNVYWYDRGQDSRDRDLIPARVAGSPLSGGADRFQDFLATELIPRINAEYRTSGRNILFGHSYAGMFTVYTFVTKPDLFQSYIASDPALWWNEGFVPALATRRLGRASVAGKTLFIGGRSGRINGAFGIRQMTDLLRTRAPAGLRWRSEVQDDEDHGSVRLKNIYDGLKFTYFGHSSSMVDFFPRDGVLVKGKPTTIMTYSTFLGEEPGVRYTLDGSEPTPKSLRFDYGVKIGRPSTLTVKQFSNWGPDRVVKGRFTDGRPFGPWALPGATTPGGLNYRCYKGEWDNVPERSNIAPTTSGRTDGALEIAHPGEGAFACTSNGYFKAGIPGYYVFFLEADMRANLYVDGHRLIDIDVAANKQSAKSFLVPLMKGGHSVQLDYFHGEGETHFTWNYLPPTNDTRLAHLPIAVPAGLLYAE